jgi:hypothetical protein
MTPIVPELHVEIRRLPDTTAGQLEARTPRAAFTRRLARLCERLDQASEVEVRFKPYLLRDDLRSGRVKLQRLWAVGSYARGALTCGDLDLVFEFTSQAGPPFPNDRDARLALFGSPPDFRFYAGTPEKNSSHVQMDSARLVWSGPGCDWRRALADIPEDRSAGPARRATSPLPLRFEQLGGADEVPDLECLIAARERGEIEWEFIPFDASLLAPLPTDLPESLGEVQRWLEEFTGAKSRAIAPAIVRLLHARYAGSPARLHRGLADLAYGNTILRLGTGYVRPSCLFSHLALSEVMIAPHMTRRGPNGAWTVRRGPRHVLTLAMADVQFWVPTALGQSSPLQELVTDDIPWQSPRQLLEGFPTKRDARRVLTRIDPDATPAPRRLDARELVLALGGTQRFEWDGRSLEAKFNDLRLTDPSAMGWEVLQALAGQQKADAARSALAAAESERRTRCLSHLGCTDELDSQPC